MLKRVGGAYMIKILDPCIAALSLAFVFYIGWHDAIALGQRTPVPGLGITSAGLANLIWFALLIIPIVLRLFFSFQAKRPSLLEALIIAYPVLVLVRTSMIDSFSLVMIYCSIWLAAFFLVLLRNTDFHVTIDKLTRYGFKTLTISLALALALPFLFPVEDYSLFQKFGPIYRYKGWLGEGQPIGFGGLFLGIWTGVEIFRTKKLSYSVLFALLISLLCIHLNLLRVALIGLAFFYAVLGIMMIRHKEFRIFSFSVAMIAFCGLSFVTGQFKAKNTERGYVAVDGTKVAPAQVGNLFAEEGGNKIEKFFAGVKKIINDPKLLDKVIITNHRAQSFNILLEESKGHRFFGKGTGEAPRYLTELVIALKTKAPHPGNEFLRIFFELGAVGLLLFIFILLKLIGTFRHTLLVPVMITFCFALCFDSFLVIPSFGFGAFLIIAWVGVRENLPTAKAS